MSGKDCTQCIHNDGCHIHCICHNQERFKPKEKPMEDKVIFESEEEARRIISIMDIPESKTEINIKILRTQGYIRKSAVEEAEEAFKDWKSSHSLGSNDIDVMNSVLKKANTYIEFLYKGFQEQNKIIEKKDDIIRNLVIECQELKSEIKRLKK